MNYLSDNQFYISRTTGSRSEITVSEDILETHVIKVYVDGKLIRRNKNKKWSFKMEINKWSQIALTYSPRRRKIKDKTHEYI